MFISICIPAYRHAYFLSRLLDSVAIQTFRDFEVIVTDDTPGTEVQDVCSRYQNKFHLTYYKNQTALGTPQNWNEGISRASGQWIKLMHHDDWFASPQSLQRFVTHTQSNPQASFIFCAYRNMYEDNSPPRDIVMNAFDKKRLQQDPIVLLARNFIGPPSTVMHRNDPQLVYDKQLKWLVDSDFYIRHPGVKNACYIPQPLVCIGVHGLQVTASAFGNRSIEVPEYMYELKKFGTHILGNVLVFDAYWRMIRNFRIRSVEDIRQSGYKDHIPTVITHMIRAQKPFSYRVLHFGLFSKFCMFACYLKNKSQLR